MLKLHLVFLLGLNLSYPLFAVNSEEWKCKGRDTKIEFNVAHEKMEAFLTLKGEIKTSRGKIPMQTHKGELSQLAWLAHRAWMFDVSDYIQDYKESYHNYQGAILSIFLNQKNPKQGVISIGQTDADPDLSGIEHYSELLDCTRLEK